MKSFILSLLLHVFLFVMLFFGLSHPSQPAIVNKGETIIHAVAVDNTQIEALEKKNSRSKKIKKLKKKVERQKKLDAEAKAKRLAEAKHSEEEKAIALQQQKAAEEKKTPPRGTKNRKGKEEAS
ncbi:MAG: hypothetical protein LRY67_02330 [Gammaproteobacteria bacterium]|nr:hypothetical protein [Gammaproteobacteria bacterium]